MTTTPVSSNTYRIKDYTFLAEDLRNMQSEFSSGSAFDAINSRNEIAQEIVDNYTENGSSISMEDALEIVDEQYEYISCGVSVEEELNSYFPPKKDDVAIDDAGSGDIIYTPQIGGGNSSSDYRIKDFTIFATDLEIMHARLSANNEREALDMRRNMAAQIMQMYTDNGSSISEKEALAMVDTQYKYISGGASVVDTINATTKSADSFWNYVPIVNLFIDDTTAEDLYKILEGEEANTKDLDKNGFAKVLSSTAAGAGAGAGIGFCFAGIGAVPGAVVGGIVGFISGITDIFV